MKSLTLLFKTWSLHPSLDSINTQNSNPMREVSQNADDRWNKGTKHKKTPRPTCIQSSQQWRSDSQVLLLLTGRRSARRKYDRTGQDRRGEVEENGGVSFYFFTCFFFFFCLATSYTPRRRCRVQVCERLIKTERKWFCSPGILCRLPRCVVWLGERVLFIQVSQGNWCLILMPHLLWPLSLPYRSPSPSLWCIFISVVTWLFKGSLA